MGDVKFMRIFVNGDELSNVVGVSYDSHINRFRVIQKGDDKNYISDYKNCDIEIYVDGDKTDYKFPIKCQYYCSDSKFIGLDGIYLCIGISDNGEVKIIDDNNDCISLKVRVDDIDKVRGIQEKNKGMIRVKVNSYGLGEIY